MTISPCGVAPRAHHRLAPFRPIEDVLVMPDYDAILGWTFTKDSISVAIADTGRSGEVRLFGTIPHEPEAVVKLVKKLSSRHGKVEFCL